MKVKNNLIYLSVREKATQLLIQKQVGLRIADNELPEDVARQEALDLANTCQKISYSASDIQYAVSTELKEYGEWEEL